MQAHLERTLPNCLVYLVLRCVTGVSQACCVRAHLCLCIPRISSTRVQHTTAWERYNIAKRRIARDNASIDEPVTRIEEMMWHGTSTSTPRVICEGSDGLDFRMVRSVLSSKPRVHWIADVAVGVVAFNLQSRAGLYGRGLYFAERAAYCHEHFAYSVPCTQLRKRLIYARVLVGREYDLGTDTEETLTKPPPGYHSIVGGPHKFNADSREASRMCVVYDNAQVYPQYIIEYEKGC